MVFKGVYLAVFTGIIEILGTVVKKEKTEDGCVLGVNFTNQCTPGLGEPADIVLGESICVNGVCLTVTQAAGGYVRQQYVEFFASPETVALTSLGRLKIGQLVNIERSMRASGAFSGHYVQGHVDGRAKLVEVKPFDQSFDLTFEVPWMLRSFCVEKGSVTLDGVSLTINRFPPCPPSSHEYFRFSVHIIPFTWSHTRFNQLKLGDEVNIEVDVIAKYVENLCRFKMPSLP
jgi:riboflavin synthase